MECENRKQHVNHIELHWNVPGTTGKSLQQHYGQLDCLKYGAMIPSEYANDATKRLRSTEKQVSWLNKRFRGERAKSISDNPGFDKDKDARITVFSKCIVVIQGAWIVSD